MQINRLIPLGPLILILAAAGCSRAPSGRKQEEPLTVRTMGVELRTVQSALEYVGDLRGRDEAIIYPKVSGKIIEKLKEEGSEVVKGDVIAYVDRDEVGFRFEKAPVESPLTGIIGRITVDIGTNVTPQTPVGMVVDMDGIEIKLDVPEKHLPRIAPGQPAEITVDSYPEKTFTGAVSRISPVVDLATRTAPVEIDLPNPGHLLKSGMFARVRVIVRESKEATAILKEAVLGTAPDTFVYVVENNIARRRAVELGERQGPYYEVAKGLRAGEQVVVMGQQKLTDGAPVAIEGDSASFEKGTGR